MVRAIVPIIAVLLAAPLSAQSERAQDVPPGHRPPAGMCRIWIEGVPPGQQPAPTDCATAVRNRPANGRVIFGDENPKPGRRTSFQPSKLRADDKEAVTESKASEKPKLEIPKKGKSKRAVKPKDAKKGNPNDI